MARKITIPVSVRLGVILASAGLLAGCIEVPELDRTLVAETASSPYPDLIPIEPLLAATGDPETEATDLQESMDARAARLRSRAEALRRQPVVDDDTRSRMEAGVSQ